MLANSFYRYCWFEISENDNAIIPDWLISFNKD